MSPIYRRIGPYEIRAAIGGGGMADVYEARDARTGQTVALKVPRQDPEIRRAERDGALLQRHLAERDPRVARVYEAGEDDGVPFVAMEYVAGHDLSERIAKGPMEPDEALRIAIELCDLLAVAHACTPAVGGRPRRGIVHGDLKPRNVRIEPAGGVRVVDFGIAKALSETRQLTHNEFGSLAYSSPERIDTGNVDDQSDLWAVGVVLYEMVTGLPPFRAASPRELERILLGRTRPAPLPPGSPPALDAVFQKAFAPRIEERYPSATAFRTDLERVRAGAPTVAEAERAAIARGVPAAGAAPDGAATTRRAGDAVAPLDAAGSPAGEATRRTLAAPGEETRRTTPASDATRRTAPAPDATRRTDADATRRTVPPGALVANGTPALAPIPPAVAPAGAPPRVPAARLAGLPRVIRIAKRVAVVVIVGLLVNESFVGNAASELGAGLATYRRSDANHVWHEYQRLRRRSLLGFGTWGVSGRVKNWHVAAADELTADWLSDTPTIRERGWQQARALLQRAASIAPGDRGVRARLLYCEGQLARIDGEALLERQQRAAARTRFNESRRLFEEAAQLRRNWPDPHLANARVLAIGFGDVERTDEALRRSERAGYQPGDRDIALRADALRLRAERTLAAVPGLPDEQRYIDRIRKDCWDALALYDQVPAYSQVNRSIRRVHELLDRLDARERALAPAPAIEESTGIDFVDPDSAGR